MEVQQQPSGPGDDRPGKSVYGYDRLAGARQLPFSEEAEQAVLGAAMVDKEAVGLAREKIDFNDFYRLEHQLIYRAMCSLYENDQAVDPITVADLLQKSSEQFLDKAQQKTFKDKDLMEIVGGMDFLIDLAGMMGTAANVTYHAGIVREKAVLRNLISVSNTIAAEAFEGADEAGKILDRAQGKIYDISEDTRVGGFEAVDSIVPGTFKSIEEAFQNNDDVTGLRTGFAEMDRRLGGLQKSDLIILAARPSMGKTSLALNLAYNVAVNEGIGVGIFSLEMAREQLVMRMLGSSGSFNQNLSCPAKRCVSNLFARNRTCASWKKNFVSLTSSSSRSTHVSDSPATFRKLSMSCHGLDLRRNSTRSSGLPSSQLGSPPPLFRSSAMNEE